MRKFTLLLLAVLIIAFAAQAQIQKRAVLLGGNISTGTGKQSFSNTGNDSESKYFHLSPSLGFVTADNTVWGFNLTTGLQTSENNSQSAKTRSSSYGGAVFYRRYLTLGKGFYLFGQAATGYNYGKQKNTVVDNTYSRTYRTDYAYVSAYPGVTFAVSKNFHLEAGLNELVSLSYTVQNETMVSNGTASTIKSKGLNFGTNFSNNNPLSVGFRFVL